MVTVAHYLIIWIEIFIRLAVKTILFYFCSIATFRNLTNKKVLLNSSSGGLGLWLEVLRTALDQLIQDTRQLLRNDYWTQVAQLNSFFSTTTCSVFESTQLQQAASQQDVFCLILY